MIAPMLLFDLTVTQRRAWCFPIYRINRVRRAIEHEPAAAKAPAGP